MDTTSKVGETEEGFAALFNEFVGKAQSSLPSSSSKRGKSAVSGDEGNKADCPSEEVDEKNIDRDQDADVESTETSARSSRSATKPLAQQTSTGNTKGSTTGTVTGVQKTNSEDCANGAGGGKDDVKEEEEKETGKHQTPQKTHGTQPSSPVASSTSSSYQTSPTSSFSSSASITPASSPLTTLQPRSTVLSVASSKLVRSTSKIPAKPEKPVLRDRAGRKRNNSLDSEFVTDFGVKRERSKSIGQPSKFKAEKEGPRYRNQKPKSSNKQPGEKRKPKPKVYRPGLDFVPGFKLEAMDFCQNKWYLAKIVQIDEEEQQVLIHFDKWNSRYDEWVDCSSERLRPLIRQSTRKEVIPQQHPTGDFKYGEEVLARWSDCRYYPAKVLSVNRNGSYRMLFYDGIEKNVLAANTRVMPDELKAQNFFSNFNLPSTPPVKGKKRWFAKESGSTPGTHPPPAPVETPPEPSSSSGVTKRRLAGSVSPLTPPLVPPKKPKVEEKVKSPKEVKPPVKPKVDAPPINEDDLPISSLLPKAQDTGQLQVVDSKAVLKPVLTPAKMEELISRNIKEPLLNDKDLGLLRDRPRKVLAPKELVIDLDHNKYKCDVKGCDKSFRKESLLEYHTKYYHATKTSTSSAASRVLSRTKKMMSGTGKHPSKVSPLKRLSAPADLVSSFQRSLGERSGPKKRLKSPVRGVQRGQGQSSPLVRKRNRVRHRSEPTKTQTDTVGKTPQVASYTSEKEESSDVAARVPPPPPLPPPPPPGQATEEVSKPKEKQVHQVQQTKSSPVSAGKSTHKEEEKVYSIVKEPAVAARTPKARQVVPERSREKGFRTKDLKSVLAEVRLVEEGIREEEEKQKHRRKHKKNKEKKRRKKKKKEKEKRRRLKSKAKTGGGGEEDEDDTDDESETEEEEQVRLVGRYQERTSGDAPVRETFKHPNSGKIIRRKTIFRPAATASSVGVNDDIVKCVCKNMEEEGFMIQCEFCNCWQHSTCVGLSSKTIPKKYMCYYCQISQGAKPHFFESEDYAWYERGYLPRMPEFGKGPRQEDKQATSLRLATNSLIGDVLTIAELLHGLQQKIAILQNPEDPEAKLWARDWILRLQKKSDLTDLARSDSCFGNILSGILSSENRENGQAMVTGQSDAASNRVSAPPSAAQTAPVGPSVMLEVASISGSSTEDPIKQVVQPSVQVPPSIIDPQASSSDVGPSAGESHCGSSQGTPPIVPGVEVAYSVKRRVEESLSQASENDPAATVVGEVPSPSRAPQEGTEVGGDLASTDSTVDVVRKEAALSGRQAARSQTTGDDLKEVAAVAPSDVINRKSATSTNQGDGDLPSASQIASKNLAATQGNLSLLDPPSLNQCKPPPSKEGSSVAPATGQATPSSNTPSTSKDTSSTGGTGPASSASEAKAAENVPSIKQSSESQDKRDRETNPGKTSPGLSSVAQNSGQSSQEGKPDQISSVLPTSQNVTNVAASSMPSTSAVASGDNTPSAGDAADCSKLAADTPSCSGEGKQMFLTMEDVIRKQMDHGSSTADGAGELRATVASEGKGPEVGIVMEKLATKMNEEKIGEASFPSASPQGTSTPGHPARAEVKGQEVTVELSQAYLLRHINTLHNQLSERLTLIEMEVEKLEKMFASSASGWNAVAEDPIATRKRLRLLLSDLKKISSIVSI